MFWFLLYHRIKKKGVEFIPVSFLQLLLHLGACVFLLFTLHHILGLFKIGLKTRNLCPTSCLEPTQCSLCLWASLHRAPLAVLGCTGAVVSRMAWTLYPLAQHRRKRSETFCKWTLPYSRVSWNVCAPPRNLMDFVHMPMMAAPGSLAGRWLLLWPSQESWCKCSYAALILMMTRRGGCCFWLRRAGSRYLAGLLAWWEG